MASKRAKLPREEKQSSAIVIPFPVVPHREAEIDAEIPFPVVPRRLAEAVSSKSAPKPASNDDRPTLPEPSRAGWWEVALVISLLIHGLAVLAFSLKYSYDLERAAGAAAAASSDGALVIPIEVVVDAAALPSAEKPTETTAPDAIKPAQTTPKDEQKAKEKVESAPPQKSDVSQEVVPTAKETPTPEKREREQKKKETAKASRSAASNPNQAAASGAQGRAGAGGRAEFGGTADVSSYRAQVTAHLARFKNFPAGANAGGTATVRFTLSSSGAVTGASLVGSSGSSVLDQAAVAMVRRASPFPSIPSNLGVSRLDFNSPIRFTSH